MARATWQGKTQGMRKKREREKMVVRARSGVVSNRQEQDMVLCSGQIS